jgi:signal transduction histidine kinase
VPLQAYRHRFLWRMRAPTGGDEIRRIERWLATARVFLANAALVAAWMDPAELGAHPLWPYLLLGFYIVHSVLVMLLFRLRQESTSSFRLLVHAADIAWPALITLFASGQRSPFFLFFLFVLVAAAYRWGLRETLGTAAIGVALLWVESLLLSRGYLDAFDRFLAGHHIPILGVNIAEFEPERLFMRSVYLLVMALLLGYLAEQQKELRAERAIINRMLGKVRVEQGMAGTLQAILQELLQVYGARRALLISQEAHSYRVFIGEAIMSSDTTSFRWLEAGAEDRSRFLFETPAEVWYLGRRGSKYSVLALDRSGERVKNPGKDLVGLLGDDDSSDSLAGVCFTFGQEWSGRIYLYEPALLADRGEELRFLLELVHQVGPAVYNVYLIRRLRQRAGAVERARVARELHDGAVQSLIAVEMQVDVLRRQADVREGVLAGELSRIQQLLREEVLKLRELMQQMKSQDVDGKKLPGFLADAVERFQRETGISARFISELDEVHLSSRICRELARIVQEALVNVRKHSRATHVLVRLSSVDGECRLTVEDDGMGFDFSGRLSERDLEGLRKGPVVIKERVRLIEGQLTIESVPGQGARLEISLNQKQEAVHG